MIENFQLKGNWCIPTNSSKSLFGILTFNHIEGTTLEVFGSFGMNSLEQPIIIGITTDGKEITLYKNYIRETSSNLFSNNGHCVFEVSTILIGKQFKAVSEIFFRTLTAEIHNLDRWLSITGFEKKGYSQEDLKEKRLSIKYKLPISVEFSLTENLKGKFAFVARHSGQSIYSSEITISQRTQITIESKQLLPFGDFLKEFFKFLNFITLGIYESTYPITLNFGLIDENNEPEIIEVFFKINKPSVLNKKYAPQMLFSYMHIKRIFEDVIKNWVSKVETLEPVFSLLFEQFYSMGPFNENVFLNLAQAAETFHSTLNKHTRIPEVEYKAMKTHILSVTLEKYHPWLKDQFKFGNSLYLHQRLRELIDKYGNEVINDLIGDKEAFVKAVKDSRNYYTHYMVTGKKKAMKDKNLFQLSLKLKALLVSALLNECGLPKELIENRMKETKNYFTAYNSIT